MSIKEQLKDEIDHLDEHYLELLHKIIRQFPHAPEKHQEEKSGKKVAALFKEIADAGDIGIRNPEKWQQENRKDRPLPFREQ